MCSQGANSIAIGGGDEDTAAFAAGNFSVAVGNSSDASGQGYATAYGYNAHADVGLGPVAVGTDSRAKGTNAAAFGRFSSATAENSTAIGSGARAIRKSAVAIGFGSIADAPNTVAVGSATARRRIVNVATARNATDAVTLGQAKQLIAAAMAAASLGNSAATAVPAIAPEPPAVSVVSVNPSSAGSGIEGMQRRLYELEALVRRQQERIAQLEKRFVTAGSPR